MYSWKAFFSYGVIRAVFSLSTVGIIALYFFKDLQVSTLIAYILFLIFASYTNFFDYLKANELPTSRVYNSGIPTTLTMLTTLYILMGVGFNIYKLF